MNGGKYIIIETMGMELAIMFDECIEHSNISNGFKNVKSAGFFTVGANQTEKDPRDISVEVFGKSVSLKKEVRKNKDEIIIKRVLRKEDKF